MNVIYETVENKPATNDIADKWGVFCVCIYKPAAAHEPSQRWENQFKEPGPTKQAARRSTLPLMINFNLWIYMHDNNTAHQQQLKVVLV